MVKSSAKLSRRASNLSPKHSMSNGHQRLRQRREATSFGSCPSGVNEKSRKIGETNRESLAKLFVKQWFRSFLSRYLRLVPMFFLVYWFKRSVFIYSFAYGQPFMDNGLDKNTQFGACKLESWSTPFTMMTAFLPLSHQCLPQAWSVAVDLFFSITVTPIALIMTKRPKLALLLGLAACSISNLIAIRAYSSIISTQEALEMVQMRIHSLAPMFGRLSYLYTYPHYRLGSCLAGVLAGYLIFKYESSTEEQARHWPPKWMQLKWATKLLSALVVLSCILILNLSNSNRDDVIEFLVTLSIQMLPLSRTLWSLANAIVFARMVTDWRRNSFLMRLLANKLWATMVKLNYVMLLIHMDVLSYLLANASATSVYSKLGVFNLFAAAYTISVPLAAFVYIVFDNPIYKITKRHVLPG